MENDTVVKIERLFDEERDAWFDVYEAPGISGKTVRVTVPREDQSPAVVRRALLRVGADLQASPQAEQALLLAISSEAPLVHRAAAVGWRDGSTRYVSHHCVAGVCADIKMISPERSTNHLLKQTGYLRGWQSIVAGAEYSMAMMVALCATFAAPLLALLRRPGFALGSKPNQPVEVVREL